MSYSEECGNFIKGFILCFRDFLICENPEESQEHAKGEESVIFQCCLHGGKSYANKKVSTPVDQNSHAHGGWPGSLGEQLGRDHPGD